MQHTIWDGMAKSWYPLCTSVCTRGDRLDGSAFLLPASGTTDRVRVESLDLSSAGKDSLSRIACQGGAVAGSPVCFTSSHKRWDRTWRAY